MTVHLHKKKKKSFTCLKLYVKFSFLLSSDGPVYDTIIVDFCPSDYLLIEKKEENKKKKF